MGAQDIIGAITGGLVQTDRLLKLDSPLGNNVLLPQRVIGRSRIGRHYEFTVDVVSTSSAIELKTLIAQQVALWIQQTDSSYLPYHGYVHTARRLGSGGSLTSYQFGFASWMHFLRFRKDARIWQNKSADTILADVFGMHPQARGAFRFVLKNPLPRARFACNTRTTGISSIASWKAKACSVILSRPMMASRTPLSLPTTFIRCQPSDNRPSRSIGPAQIAKPTRWCSGPACEHCKVQRFLLEPSITRHRARPRIQKARTLRRLPLREICLSKLKSMNIRALIPTAPRIGVMPFQRFAWKNGNRGRSAFTVQAAFGKWMPVAGLNWMITLPTPPIASRTDSSQLSRLHGSLRTIFPYPVRPAISRIA